MSYTARPAILPRDWHAVIGAAVRAEVKLPIGFNVLRKEPHATSISWQSSYQQFRTEMERD